MSAMRSARDTGLIIACLGGSTTIVLDEQRALELQQALNRSLNCDSGAPRWITALCDLLDPKPVPAIFNARKD
jgi:uncharacterized metal-binding protein